MDISNRGKGGVINTFSIIDTTVVEIKDKASQEGTQRQTLHEPG